MKKSIIYAWNYIEWGGAQIYVLALIREARKYYDILVVMPHESRNDLIGFFDELGVKYEFYGQKTDLDAAGTLRRKLQRHWRKIRSEVALVRHLLSKDLTNSILHIDLPPQQSFIALARLSRYTHVFITMHNSLGKFSRWRELIWTAKLRLLTRTGRFHIFCSNNHAKEYMSHFVSPSVVKRIMVTRTAINPEKMKNVLVAPFDKRTVRKRFDLPDGKTIVLTVGQFVDRKGRWTCLEAIRNICRTRRDILFLWVMPKFPMDFDRAKVDEFGVGKHFKMILSSDIGNSRNEILQFFRVADVYLLPSFVEGVPISLLEAMALGLPCISTNVYGIPEAIKSGETGLLVNPGDVSALKKAITTMVDNSVLREKLARRGQSFVLSKFDERVAAEIAINEYRKHLRTT